MMTVQQAIAKLKSSDGEAAGQEQISAGLIQSRSGARSASPRARATTIGQTGRSRKAVRPLNSVVSHTASTWRRGDRSGGSACYTCEPWRSPAASTTKAPSVHRRRASVRPMFR